MANGIVFPTRAAVYVKSVPLPYFTTDDWKVPPVLQELIQKPPVAHNMIPWYDSVRTTVSRAYDWLVTQYSNITQPLPPPPGPFGTKGKVIPSYLYNMPSNYPQTRAF